MSDQRPQDEDGWTASPDGAAEHRTEVIPNPYATLTPPPPPPPVSPPPPTAGDSYPPAAPNPLLTGAGGPTGPATPPSTKSGGSGGMGKVVATAAAVGLLLGGVGGYAGYTLASNNDTTVSNTSGSTAISIPAEDLSPRAEDSIADIAQRMLPTVVSIEEQGSSGTGTGSGFIIREDGYIVTNNHVVEGAAGGGSLTVQFEDGTTEDAQIVGRNPSYDLAVIKVDASGLPVASIGNSNDMQVGDTVVAVGSPLGLSGTVTSGIISATNRPVTAGGQGETSYINALQTDAAINPGNSGGPLVNAAAEVIGVNSAIASLGADASGQAGSIGLGFAIPSNTAKRIVEEIIKTGSASTPVIGVNLDVENDATGGAAVGSVVADGPAAKAGIKSGDVVTAVNGVPVTDAVALITQIRSFAPGETVKLTVESGGKTSDVEVTLGSKSD
ncbi:MAG: hypothetical protein QG597_3053 [Actinomycetota bacterium]|nr:hypothetical protein [Actinomycetota bacterium]